MTDQWERFLSRGVEAIGGYGLAEGALRRPAASNHVGETAAVRRVVEAELLPRLARAHRQSKQTEPSSRTFSARDVAEFAALSLGTDDMATLERVKRHMGKGRSLERVYLDLIQPAAQMLGDEWVEDRATFAAVTLGLCQMHKVLREFSPTFIAPGTRHLVGQHALLCPAASEQHSLGLAMVAEFLRRDGWAVTGGPFPLEHGLEAAMRNTSVVLVGFSLSCDSGLEALAGQISRVRQLTRNRTVTVMVGGRVFNDRPELVARVGADATASDAAQAAAISRRARLASANHRI